MFFATNIRNFEELSKEILQKKHIIFRPSERFKKRPRIAILKGYAYPDSEGASWTSACALVMKEGSENQ